MANKPILRNKTAVKDGVQVPYVEKVLRQNISVSSNKATPIVSQNDINLDKTHQDYDILDPRWGKLYDCFMGGGFVENASDDVYLVKNDNEKQKKYDIRKKLSKYYNKSAQVIGTFQGHIWRREPNRILPDSTTILIENVDRMGMSANRFFAQVTKWAQVLGAYYVLVEYPLNPGYGELEKQSIADERALGLRPYLRMIDPRDVLDWGFSTSLGGSPVLEFAVIRENEILFKSPFYPTKTQTRYRVLYPNRQEIWVYDEMGDKKEPSLLAELPNSLGAVPLVPFYGDEIRYGVGKSALYDIAGLNLELYNKHSARVFAELMAAFPILCLIGWDDDTPVKVSEDMALLNPNTDSHASYLEFSGQSIGALRDSEKDIIAEIIDIALKQVRTTSGQREAAESKRIDRLESMSELQARAWGFANSEKQVWKYAAKWMGEKESDVSVSYNLDFSLDQIQSDLVARLMDMRAMGDLSRSTLWDVLKDGEVLPKNFDPEMEQKKLEEEATVQIPYAPGAGEGEVG